MTINREFFIRCDRFLGRPEVGRTAGAGPLRDCVLALSTDRNTASTLPVWESGEVPRGFSVRNGYVNYAWQK
jgi:hypothetical protein